MHLCRLATEGFNLGSREGSVRDGGVRALAGGEWDGSEYAGDTELEEGNVSDMLERELCVNVGTPSGHVHLGIMSADSAKANGEPHLALSLGAPHAVRFGFVALHQYQSPYSYRRIWLTNFDFLGSARQTAYKAYVSCVALRNLIDISPVLLRVYFGLFL